MNYGFVYVLANDYMPDLIKVGCTERSPFARACELSKGTAVPAPFQVLCYAEFEDFQQVEREAHHWLKHFRVNEGREFFHDCLVSAVRFLWWHPRRLSFTDATASRQCPGESELLMKLSESLEGTTAFPDLADPWAPKEAVADKAQLQVIAGGAL